MTKTNLFALPLLFAFSCAPDTREPSPHLGRDGRPLGSGTPSCDHDECAAGNPLLSSCSACAADVCAFDSYCCQVQWDGICVDEAQQSCNLSCQGGTCDHDRCQSGGPLMTTCDPCVGDICAADPFCCNNGWDSICVAEVATVCGLSCMMPPPPPPCAHALCDPGDILDPACDPCAQSVCDADPYCCTGQWDRVCVREVETVCGQTCEPPVGMNAVDILFVVDSSCSMADEQSSLGGQASVFFAHLAAQGYDYRIAVTTTDVSSTGEQGSFVGNPPIIDGSTPNPEQAFAANVDVGVNGDGIEQGLEGMHLALTGNPGFPRADASLVVIALSDEEDQSPAQITFYESFLAGIVSPPRSVTFNAIVGTATAASGCFSDLGDRYQAVAASTNGTVVSICGPDWSPALTAF